MNQTAQKFDTVTIHYTARTDAGGVIENTLNRKPLQLSLDDESFLPALREQIVGMAPGDVKTVSLAPEKVFGVRQSQCQMEVDARCLPTGIQAGDQLSVKLQGKEVNAWVVQKFDEEATIDINHPLVGESLTFEIQLLNIE